MSIKLQLPKLTELKPRIVVIGIGGAGGNAVNNMIASGLTGVEFVVANTDAQALVASSAEHRLQLGTNLTEGLGAGARPEIGEAAAEEAVEDIRQQLSGAHMCFIAAGMGGGTGTGAAPVVARVAKSLGLLTVAVVTRPFQFEGARRMRMADAGIAALGQHVDTMIVVPNQNLFRIATEKTTFADAFRLADQVLHSGIACIVDLIVRDGLINLDFADVRTVMADMGTAMMGTGEASGPHRAQQAAEAAIQNPILDEVSLRGARGLLLSITGGRDLTLYEVDEAASRIRKEVDADANIIVGATFDDTLTETIRVSIVATGVAGRTAHTQQPGAHSGAQAAAQPGGPPTSLGQGLKRKLSEALRPEAYRGRAEEAAPEATPLELTQDEEMPVGGQRWTGPGDVTISEDMPRVLQGAQPAPQRSPQPAGDDGYHFQPMPPATPRGADRRIPELSEFPPIAQQAYRGGPARQAGDAVRETPRKGGFLSRFSLGRGRAAPEADESTSDSPYSRSQKR
jgi:cell division protein FtsZ